MFSILIQIEYLYLLFHCCKEHSQQRLLKRWPKDLPRFVRLDDLVSLCSLIWSHESPFLIENFISPWVSFQNSCLDYSRQPRVLHPLEFIDRVFKKKKFGSFHLDFLAECFRPESGFLICAGPRPVSRNFLFQQNRFCCTLVYSFKYIMQ